MRGQYSPSSVVLMDALAPEIRSDSMLARAAVDVGLMFGFATFVALSAQIAVRLPWTTVPITGQTFAVLVAGGALGARRGAGSLVIYMLLGMLAIPVFAPAASSLGLSGDWAVHFILPWQGSAGLPWDISSGGYIVGFILAAYLVGHLAEKGWDRKPLGLFGMLLGNALLYVPGLLWLFYLISSQWVPGGAPQAIGEYIAGDGALDKTLKGGLYPFIAGDIMKLYLAALALPSAWAMVNKFKGRR